MTSAAQSGAVVIHRGASRKSEDGSRKYKCQNKKTHYEHSRCKRHAPDVRLDTPHDSTGKCRRDYRRLAFQFRECRVKGSRNFACRTASPQFEGERRPFMNGKRRGGKQMKKTYLRAGRRRSSPGLFALNSLASAWS